MEVHQQNALFQYFSDTLNAVIHNAKKNGRYDMGILGEEAFPGWAVQVVLELWPQ